jgi:hypothetical protein
MSLTDGKEIIMIIMKQISNFYLYLYSFMNDLENYL